jgi:hypothetical protein
MNTNNEKPLLGNLAKIIRNSSIKYSNEFVWQDVELTVEFQNSFEEYLKKTNYNIEFHKSSAVITSPLSKYIFVPNQWFVIASYAVEIYEELYKYKGFFKDVTASLGEKPDAYAKQLRDNASILDKNEFISCAESILKRKHNDHQRIAEAKERLWRFVNDYSWWSGQKTIDRTDFHVSVILNMLNLVNASQGYVADIVSAYANDYLLRLLVREVDGFTVNLTCNIIEDVSSKESNYSYVEENRTSSLCEEKSAYSENGRTILKIGSKNLKEIKYKK